MRIEVLFFAHIKDALASEGEILELETEKTVNDVVASLRGREEWSDLASIPLTFAVNEDFVDGDHALREGDRLALLPPVSGG